MPSWARADSEEHLHVAGREALPPLPSRLAESVEEEGAMTRSDRAFRAYAEDKETE